MTAVVFPYLTNIVSSPSLFEYKLVYSYFYTQLNKAEIFTKLHLLFSNRVRLGIVSNLENGNMKCMTYQGCEKVTFTIFHKLETQKTHADFLVANGDKPIYYVEIVPGRNSMWFSKLKYALVSYLNCSLIPTDSSEKALYSQGNGLLSSTFEYLENEMDNNYKNCAVDIHDEVKKCLDDLYKTKSDEQKIRALERMSFLPIYTIKGTPEHRKLFEYIMDRFSEIKKANLGVTCDLPYLLCILSVFGIPVKDLDKFYRTHKRYVFPKTKEEEALRLMTNRLMRRVL